MAPQEQPLFVKRRFPFKVQLDYRRQKTPQAKHLCNEAVMLPIAVLMDGPRAATDVVAAIEKARRHADRLVKRSKRQ